VRSATPIRWNVDVRCAFTVRSLMPSRRAICFNMLTSYSDPERMLDRLYYGDPAPGTGQPGQALGRGDVVPLSGHDQGVDTLRQRGERTQRDRRRHEHEAGESLGRGDGGGHLRADYPHADPSLDAIHLVLRPDGTLHRERWS